MPILFVALFNSILGLSVLFPILAPLGRELGLTELQVGSLSTAYALAQFVMGPVWGRRSERVGRKPVLLVGILGFAGGFALFGAAAELGRRGLLTGFPLFAALFSSRLLGGAFSSATIPTAQAYVADTTGRADRTAGMAVIGAAFGLGIIVGPALGAALSQFDLLAPVYFSAAVAVANAVFVAVRLREPDRHLKADSPPMGPLVARLWPLLAVGVTVSLSSVAMEQTIGFYFQDRLALRAEETASAVGIALVFYGVVAVIAQGVLVRKLKWAPLRLLVSGLPCAFAGFIVLVFARGSVGLTLGLSLQGFGQGLAVPGVTAALSLGVSEDEQGTVAGLNGSAQALGRLLGPLVGTGLYEIHPEYPYMMSACLLVLVLGSVAVSPRLRAAVSAS